MHIYDFILDETQYQLKSEALNGLQVFEAHLSNYYNIFVSRFDALRPDSEPAGLHDTLKKNPAVIKWFDDLLTLLRNERESFIRLFEDILDAYRIFISGDHVSAVIFLRHLLVKNDLLDHSFEGELGAFLRGRYFSGNDDILNEGFFYHIPFNGRFLIKNQRFSFSGHPLLYAGQSLMAVFYELGAKDLNDDTIATCLLAFNHFADFHYGDNWEKIKQRDKIYDITNAIYELVNDSFFRLIDLGIPIPESDWGPGFPRDRKLRSFRKFILSHCCTFPKRIHEITDSNGNRTIFPNPHFIEEYALPQLLTQAVRMQGYNGILYPSTKFIGKTISVSSGLHSHIYMTNLAMFTEYRIADNWLPNIDKELFEILQVDTVDFKNLGKYDFKISALKEFDVENDSGDFLKHLKKISEIIRKKIPVSEVSNKILMSFYHIEKKISLYRGLTIDGSSYFRTLAGRMEYIYLIRYYRLINSQFNRLYREEIEKEGFWEL